MIPQAYINEWRANAPWPDDSQIEQDLILSRAIAEIFSNLFLAKSLAFRGGTALHKLFIQPAGRYSEDIDLVQINSGPIGPVLEELRKQLDPWIGKPKYKNNTGLTTLFYRFNSESQPVTSKKLKIEINTREHFDVLGLIEKSYEIKSTWYTNQQVLIPTYTLEELLGTKLRALYQRKKGRDLFDISLAFKQFPNLNVTNIIKCFWHYTNFSGQKVTRIEFENNLKNKLKDDAFMNDVKKFLPRINNYADHMFSDHTLLSDQEKIFDPLVEIKNIKEKIIDCLI